jgi:hypothetical protein
MEVGSAATVIVTGGRASVSLTLTPPPVVFRVPLEGTVTIPEAWDLQKFSLRFDLMDMSLGSSAPSFFSIYSQWMVRSPETATVFRWKAPAVQPGRYAVELDPPIFRAVIDVPAQGLLDARIELPPPTTVIVRCVDDSSGLDLDGASVGCKPGIVEHDAVNHCFRLRAPIGQVVISAYCDDYDGPSEEHTLLPGENSIVLRLRKLCSFKLILRDGETVIRIGDVNVRLDPAEGQEEYEASDGELLFRRDPGLYTLEIPTIFGFEPVPDVTVRLEVGRVVEHVVHLVRTH